MERLVGQEGAPGTTGMDHRHSHTPLAARELRTKDTLAEAIAVIQVRVQEGEQRERLEHLLEVGLWVLAAREEPLQLMLLLSLGLEAAGAVFMLLLEQPQVVPGEADRAQVLLELTEPLILVQAAVVSARTRLLRQQGQEDQASLLCEWQLMIIPVRNQEEQ
tara:strand:- start:79 stop:564 length:486 start_codon:yes stop_codon:yes gene_type:complete